MYGTETSGVPHEHGIASEADGAAPGGSLHERQLPSGYTLQCLIALLRLADRNHVIRPIESQRLQ
jgi:hypothetical protein